MSVFDVIRYPISTPPTVEELEALPTELFIRWMTDNRCSWSTVEDNGHLLSSPRWVATWSHGYHADAANAKLEMERDFLLLRQLIGEWQG